MRRNPTLDVPKVLLAHGTSLDSLERAAVIGNAIVDQFLVDNGVQLRGLEEVFRHCPTWMCVRREYLHAMVDHGADPRGLDGFHNWHVVISSGTIQAVRMLLEVWCVDVDARHRGGITPLMRAVNSNHTWAMRRLIEMGADLGAVDRQGRSALAIAAANSSLTVVELLLSRGADPNQTDAEGRTVLEFAWRRWPPEGPLIVQLLLKYGAR